MSKTSALTAIGPTIPLHERVYQQIVDALMSGQFEPGQKLTSRKVARELGTSAMPVRTAFNRLRAQRAVEVLPNGSIKLPPLTREFFSSLTEARVAVEGAATELATMRLNGNNMRSVRRHCEECTLAAKTSDFDRYFQASFDFKSSIYRHCGNEHLLFLVETLWLRAGPLLHKLFEATVLGATGILNADTYQKTVEALEAKDAVRARNTIVQDLRDTANHLLEHARSSHDPNS